ncbi:hypothetical protein [Streptomyces sp. CAI 127]|uniref:hypothetical protein n=1 Tax=Streptomyces sp. CAI 127 TaxID=1076397 RepID=UPI00158721D5|nr:hypothetical protein [Streptomyces sp. CAI 127]NUW02901.1 hypothetical protein [Streptomyces sp. CAI 127]
MSRSMIRTAALAAVVLLAAGCAADDQDATSTDHGPPSALYEAARTYQEAAARGDWRTACAATTTRRQGGSLARCLDSHPDPAPAPKATADSPPPLTVEPPRYADGSTPAPRETRTADGPARASTGPVSTTDAQPAPASGEHPAGYAVLVTYTVTWPGKAPSTTRRALRLVQEGGAWRVDQLADLHPGETSLLSALGGRP